MHNFKVHKIKIIAYLICSACFLLLSCNNENNKKYTIGVSQCSDDLWRHTVNDEMLREASFYPKTQLLFKSVKDDTQKQIEDIESFIEQGVDLLVISPNESAAMTPVVQKAMQHNIPVILLDRKIETQDYTAHIGGDNYQIGYEIGLYTVQQLKGKGNVVEIRGLEGSTADKERHDGFMAVIRKYPNIKIVAECRGDFLMETAQKEMEQLLTKVDNIDLVFAMNDPMAKGVNNALKQYSGKRPFIIGIDALPGDEGGIENIKKGIQNASFIYPTGGDKVIDLAMSILENKPFSKENVLYTAVVDKTNARVIQLQTDQIFEHQEKLKLMNNMLDQSILRYSNQKNLLYAVVLILFLILVLLLISIKAYRNKSVTNRKLEKQNKEIQEQADILSQQKEQLMMLSKQLEEATHDKLVFFTNISHEFRTPLSLILGPVETLLKSSHLNVEEKKLLDLVKRNSKRLLSLISQIIEFRSYENGKMKIYLTQDNISEFLQDLNVVFSDYAIQQKITFEYKTSEGDFNIWFDKEKTEKIYYNLLSNAFKYSNQQGTISVFLERIIEEGISYIKLSVFNTGKAIPQDKIKSIFDRFFKVNPHDAGTGIGLALTSVLVEVLHGKISVNSVDQVGTTFTVLLPTEPILDENVQEENIYTRGYTESLLDLENVQDEELFADIHQNNDKPLVLLIEDNADMRSFMHFTLQNDYTIIEAEDGVVGIEKALKFIPDIIISDVMMPHKDGYEVCSTLKENISTSHIPIILLTACSLDEQKAIGFDCGADAYISKPFNAELLSIRIRKLIESREKIKQVFGNNIVTESKKVTLGDVEQAFIARFKAYIETNISKPDLSVDDIAAEMDVSRVQLYRKIKSLTDYSPVELIKIIRLKYAVELLNTKTKKMAEVAYEAGFSSPSYFTKCFKEFYKESPTDYMKRISEIDK